MLESILMLAHEPLQRNRSLFTTTSPSSTRRIILFLCSTTFSTHTILASASNRILYDAWLSRLEPSFCFLSFLVAFRCGFALGWFYQHVNRISNADEINQCNIVHYSYHNRHIIPLLYSRSKRFIIIERRLKPLFKP